MNTLELKEKLKNYVDQADVDLLYIIQAIFEREHQSKKISPKVKDILDKRLKFHEKHPDDGESWKNIRHNLKEKYGL